jgi:hypothetical protein
MTNSATRKRLDKIDLQLTPKQWAIRLADEIRRYPSEEDLSMAIAEGTFRHSPFVAPFFKLGEQAEELWPGRSPEDIRARLKLNRELRGEFQALKWLINNINGAIKTTTEKNKFEGGAAAIQTSHDDLAGRFRAEWRHRNNAREPSETNAAAPSFTPRRVGRYCL